MLNYLRNVWNAVVNRYEAGQKYSTKRTYLPGFVQDPRFDCDTATRSELVRKSRWFEKNDPLANRLAEVFTEFTVGAGGLPMIPASSDEDWNQRSSDWLGEWYPFADLTTRHGYGGLMTTAGWRRFFDGEFFLLKTKGETNRPRLQGISAHRVGTPMGKLDNDRIIDGVQIDGRGRVEGYHIQVNPQDDEYTFRTVNEVIHIFEPESPGQYRGLPLLTPVMNLLHDWNDLHMFEMAAAKEASATTNTIENPTGTVDPNQLYRLRYSQSNQKATDATDTTENRVKYFKQVLGPRTVALRQGEKLSQMVSSRPSITTQWFMDYVASLICIGTGGISKQLVFPGSMQGTVARGDLALAATYFKSRFVPFQSAAREAYIYTMGSARFIDSRVADAPYDWMKVNIRPPRSPDVDVGRNSSARIAEFESGLTTAEEIFGERGMDWREQFRQRAREEQHIDKLAAEFSLSPDRIRKAIGESLKLDMEKETERQAQEDLIAA